MLQHLSESLPPLSYAETAPFISAFRVAAQADGITWKELEPLVKAENTAPLYARCPAIAAVLEKWLAGEGAPTVTEALAARRFHD